MTIFATFLDDVVNTSKLSLEYVKTPKNFEKNKNKVKYDDVVNE